MSKRKVEAGRWAYPGEDGADWLARAVAATRRVRAACLHQGMLECIWRGPIGFHQPHMSEKSI